ncbi:hypothetical protein KGF56_002840 [Candida oxycetoniae]|uniref:Calcineurin-like phosphoesterase domain-containing protein n=1 Tax=Candida oxycetoniae TaxID=497107 RepID=A0AAI9WY03_9ASCO|nr:uncharacterized protein KGF56_002840 [Candida oxycetoniae]KAI3404320.2 hypothetical protein KGF56_002840 [Candida oxycetoniae]
MRFMIGIGVIYGVVFIALSTLCGSTHTDPVIRSLKWNDINFLHTTDTHGWYSGHINQNQYNADWGDFVSFVTHQREISRKQGQDFLLIDCGDRHDGNGLSDITTPNGLKSTPIFIKQSYDILTIGNHELYLLENSQMEFEVVAKHFSEEYVCSNVEYKLANGTFVPFGSKYRYFETPVQKKKVLVFGFLFDFKRFNKGTRVTSIEEEMNKSWFKDTLQLFQNKVDLIIIAGHTPVAHEWPEFYALHKRLRQFYPSTIIQYFGGHSHIRDFVVFDSRSTGIQSGRYSETVGWVSINMSHVELPEKERFARKYIDFNKDSFLKHSNKTSKAAFDTPKGREVTKLIKSTREELKLNNLIGTVSMNYYVDYVPVDHPKSIWNLLTNHVLPTLPGSGERLIIINTGSIRYDLYKGPYTVDSQFIVSPFENKWVNLTVPKSVATRVVEKLNDASYISASRLKPPQQYVNNKNMWNFNQASSQQPLLLLEDISSSKSKTRLTKGYITHDDFGSDGDDTLHRGVVNFKIPNVVQSVQFEDESDHNIDLIFYDFITPNVLWALRELKYRVDNKNPDVYSNVYLGALLNDYIKQNLA